MAWLYPDWAVPVGTKILYEGKIGTIEALDTEDGRYSVSFDYNYRYLRRTEFTLLPSTKIWPAIIALLFIAALVTVFTW